MKSILILFLFLTCCVSTEKFDSLKESERKSFLYDLKFKVNDFWFVGFALPQKTIDSKYRILIEPSGDKIDRLIITTCHRQDVIDKPGNLGWLQKGVLYDYSNQGMIESKKTCPMHIYALEEKTRRVGFGFIDFQDERPEYDLSMQSVCNGKTQYFIGRGYCQSAENLTQLFIFPEKVIVSPVSQRPECMIFDSSPKEKFEFKIPQGFCTYQFVSKRKHANGERMKMRVYTYGFNEVPVRF